MDANTIIGYVKAFLDLAKKLVAIFTDSATSKQVDGYLDQVGQATDEIGGFLDKISK